MSGGSFGYVYLRVQDPPELDYALSGMLDELELRATQDPLYALPLSDARAALERIRSAHRELAALAPLFKAVEWHASGDWGENDVAEAARAYRRAKETP